MVRSKGQQKLKDKWPQKLLLQYNLIGLKKDEMSGMVTLSGINV
jgi:hypothetical protein